MRPESESGVKAGCGALEGNTTTGKCRDRFDPPQFDTPYTLAFRHVTSFWPSAVLLHQCRADPHVLAATNHGRSSIRLQLTRRTIHRESMLPAPSRSRYLIECVDRLLVESTISQAPRRTTQAYHENQGPVNCMKTAVTKAEVGFVAACLSTVPPS